MKPDQCMLVEDAISGIEAAKRGGFGMIVALDRSPDGKLVLTTNDNKGSLGKQFREAGADVVLRDFDDISSDPKELHKTSESQ